MRRHREALLVLVLPAAAGAVLFGCHSEKPVVIQKPPAQLAEDQIKAIENNPNLPDDAKRNQIYMIQQNQLHAQYKGPTVNSGPVSKR